MTPPPVVEEIVEPQPEPKVDAQGIGYREYHDSPAGSRKRHHTERFRDLSNAKRLVERWTNAKAGFVGFLTGRGYTSTEIERIINDGTSKDTVRGLWRRWGLPLTETGGRRCFVVPVPLKQVTRQQLTRRARQAGVTPDEFLRRIIISVVEDDLYKAVVDDRFDPEPESSKVTG